MESTKRTLRAVMPLLKARVVDRSGTNFKIALGGGSAVTITITPADMSLYDIRDGDLLTLYTEVPFAQPIQPPIQ